MVKNCDLGLENAARGLRPRAAFSRPLSQFFTIRTSQPANNIYNSYANYLVKILSARHVRSFKITQRDPIFLGDMCCDRL